jgi:hypothetical protein
MSAEKEIGEIINNGIDDNVLYQRLKSMNMKYKDHADVVAVKALIFRERKALYDRLVEDSVFPMHW